MLQVPPNTPSYVQSAVWSTHRHINRKAPRSSRPRCHVTQLLWSMMAWYYHSVLSNQQSCGTGLFSSEELFKAYLKGHHQMKAYPRSNPKRSASRIPSPVSLGTPLVSKTVRACTSLLESWRESSSLMNWGLQRRGLGLSALSGIAICHWSPVWGQLQGCLAWLAVRGLSNPWAKGKLVWRDLVSLWRSWMIKMMHQRMQMKIWMTRRWRMSSRFKTSWMDYLSRSKGSVDGAIHGPCGQMKSTKICLQLSDAMGRASVRSREIWARDAHRSKYCRNCLIWRNGLISARLTSSRSSHREDSLSKVEKNYGWISRLS